MDAQNIDLITKQFCKTHNIDYSLLENQYIDKESPLACNICQEQNKNKQYMSIQQIKINGREKPIFNWPKGMSQQAYKFLDSYNQGKIKDIRNQIIKFYDQLQQEIQKELDLSKKQQIQQLDEHFKQFSTITQFYYDSFKVEQLKNIVIYDEQKIIYQYKKLLNELNNRANNPTIEDNLQTLHRYIESFQNVDNKIEFESSYKIQDNIKSIIKQIKFIPEIPEISPQLPYQNQQLQALQNQHQNQNLQAFQQFQIYENQMQQSSTQNYQQQMTNSKINQQQTLIYANIMAQSEIDFIFSQQIKNKMSNNAINLLRFKSEFSKENMNKLIIESQYIYNNQNLNYQSFLNKLIQMFKNIFDSGILGDEQQLAEQIAIYFNKNLQTEINQILLSKNTNLIQKWIPLIQVYQKSLSLYSEFQLKNNQQQMDRPLFRPALIPQYHFNKLIKVNNPICFTSFQTFVSSQSLATQYIFHKNQNNQNVNVIFVYKPEINLSNALRPVQIDQEFITLPLIVYKIIDIKENRSNKNIQIEVFIQKNQL
ncbi:hypothetical protein ABPG72_022729 [Tetrahymena utriculariae]